MDRIEARSRFASARVARLATTDAQGRPHLVPVCFAIEDDTIVSAVDDKPKTTAALRRLSNVRASPEVCLLADEYFEDWTRLWWVRADGTATVVDHVDDVDHADHSDGDVHADAIARLVAKYPQYRHARPKGPVLVVTVERWSGWEWSGRR